MGNGDWEFGNERESGESDNWEKEGRRQRVIQKGEGESHRAGKKRRSRIYIQHAGMWELGFRELRFAPGIGKWGFTGKKPRVIQKGEGGRRNREQTPHTEKNNREKEKL